jgi:hypothetical protein
MTESYTYDKMTTQALGWLVPSIDIYPWPEEGSRRKVDKAKAVMEKDV